MNIFQKILGTIFPPYKFNVLQKEEQQLFDAIVDALPATCAVIKEQSITGRLRGFSDWHIYPGFKFISRAYMGEEMLKKKERGLNLKITGVGIYSKQTGNSENLELLVKDGRICGLHITNSKYRLSEFDLNKIITTNIEQSPFTFPPDPVDLFYNALPQEIKDKLAIDDIEEVEFNNRTFYSFYDLEDGNCLAVDKNLKVYSLVHDAQPAVKGLKISFIDILNDKFDTSKDYL